jgi:glutamate carboxypeptidase
MNELLRRARDGAPEMTACLQALCEIESPSTDPAGVESAARFLAPQFEALGLAAELVPVAGAGPVLRAKNRGGHGAERPVMLLGHLDTVWPLGTLAARPVRIEGDRMTAPGGYDMKGGLVVVLFALRALAARGPLPPVTVFFTPLEEVDNTPYRALMEDEMRACSACLDFEPAWPGGAVKTGRKGSGQFKLRALGRSSHAGADLALGANAIVELAHQALAVQPLTDPARGTSVNVGVIRGGIRTNVVPDLAELEMDFRYPSLEEGRRIEAAVRGLQPRVAGVRLEVEGGMNYPPLERNERTLSVYAKAKAAADALGLPLSEVVTGGASEASFASALGLPTLDGLGPDGDGAHALHEHVLLPSLPERVALTAELLTRL